MQILRTKLAPPRLRTALVARDTLLARLDQGLEHKLTLLSAPAGFGKTTLVCQWLRQIADSLDPNLQSAIYNLQSPRVAWVALDAGDDDPVRFWRYVATACHSAQGAA